MRKLRRMIYVLVLLMTAPITIAALTWYVLIELAIIGTSYWIYTGNNPNKIHYIYRDGLFGMWLRLLEKIKGYKN